MRPVHRTTPMAGREEPDATTTGGCKRRVRWRKPECAQGPQRRLESSNQRSGPPETFHLASLLHAAGLGKVRAPEPKNWPVAVRCYVVATGSCRVEPACEKKAGLPALQVVKERLF